MNDLIQVIQLPVIEERLRSLKETVDKQVTDALALVCTEETVQTVKAVRSDLNKQFQALEEQRKEVKRAVLGPYEQFEAVYKECVSDGFKRADAVLKVKISDVEAEMKRRCEEGLREYFSELCTAEHVEWLTYDRAGVTVDMASAKAKTPKKLREQLAGFVANVSRGVEMISSMDDAEEIMVEFKRTWTLPRPSPLSRSGTGASRLRKRPRHPGMPPRPERQRPWQRWTQQRLRWCSRLWRQSRSTSAPSPSTPQSPSSAG